MTEIKKRGRPRKVVPIEPEAPAKVSTVEKVVGVVKRVKNKPEANLATQTIYNGDHKSKKHIIIEIIDYIMEHAGTLEKANITYQSSQKKWNPRYYVYKNLISFFNIDDKTFNGESLK